MDLQNGDKFTFDVLVSCSKNGCFVSGMCAEKMKPKETNPKMLVWDMNMVVYTCECGKELSFHVSLDDYDGKVSGECSRCGKPYNIEEITKFYEDELRNETKRSKRSNPMD